MNRLADTNLTHVDVAIVGGGLVGAALACALAADKRLSIAVIDSLKSPLEPIVDTHRFDSRIIALNDSSKAFLQQLDAWQFIPRYSDYNTMVVWDSQGSGELNFSSRDYRISALGSLVENSLMRAALWKRMRQLPSIKLLANTQVKRVHTASGGRPPILSLARQASNEPSLLQGQLLCIADGGSSSLSQQLGFPKQVFDCPQSAIVTTVETELPHQDTAWQRFLPTGPLALLPLPDLDSLRLKPKHLCSIVWSLDNDQLKPVYRLSGDDFSRRLTEAFDNRLGYLRETGDRYRFPLRQQQATQYVKPYIALLGDCAHSIHPLAGQGANLGLQDARVLADTLASRQQLPLGSLPLLRRYQRQCQASNFIMGLTIDGIRRLFSTSNMTTRYLRNFGLNNVQNCGALKKLSVSLASQKPVREL